ncbi:MAG: efflux RND transporter permease subunit [Hyphomicrobiales bacterium]|nr:efflux RND transporter permease subunit [Hyphomicrobiales bacterium]
MNAAATVLIRYRYLVIIVFAVIVAAGFLQSRDRSLDILPEFSPPLVEVQTEALGLSAEEVEALITVPLEADLLNGISWIKTIRSRSMPGLSSIVMVFEDDTDIWKARQLIQERLTQAHALPNVSRPPVMLQPLSSTSRVMQVGLTSEELSNIEISVEAHWVMRPRLMGVAGVANVSIWGMRNRQLQVQVDPGRLQAEDISLDQIVSTAGNSLWFSPLSFLNASTPGSGGFIDTPNQRLTVRHVLPISTADDLANVAVEGTRVRLGDVTTIVEDHQPLIGDALVGDGPGVLLVIEKFPWADTVAVTEGIEAALVDLSLSLPGVDIDTSIFRPASFIETATANLWRATLIGAGLLLVALVIGLRNWRATIVAAVAIPVSMITAFTVLLFAGVGFDIIMMSGLMAAIGAIVTDATVDAGLYRRVGRVGTPYSRMASLLGQSRSALAYGTVIAVLATLPMFAMSGVAGAVAMSVALPFAVAVIVSFIVSVTLVPVLAALVMPAGTAAPTASARAAPTTGGGHGLAVSARGPMFGAACVLAVVAIGLAAVAERAVVPTFKERDIVIDWAAAPGTSHPAMARFVANVAGDLRGLPGVDNVGAHIGRAINSDRVGNVNTAQVWVKLGADADYDASLAGIREIVDGYPGAAGEVLNYSEERKRAYTRPVDDTVTLRIFGYDMEILGDLAAEMQTLVSGVDGVSDVEIEERVLEPVVRIEADLDRAKAFGLRPGDVRRTAAVLLSGLEVGSLYEDQKVFEVVVWGVPEIRGNVTSVRDLMIDGPGGGPVRLGDVADVSVGSLPNIIHRDAVSRFIDVTARVDGGNVNAIAEEITGKVAAIQFPLEYHAELLTDFAEAQANNNRLLLAMAAALIGVFLLVQAAAGGWRLGAAAFVALLAATSGGAIVVAVTGGVLSLGAIAGLLATVAIASRGALVLIRDFQRLEREGEPFGPDLVARGTRARTAAIITTGIGTALAVVPAAVLAGLPGLETLGPLAMVLIGGVITTTLVNLCAVPALYLLFGRGTATSDLLSEGHSHAA